MVKPSNVEVVKNRIADAFDPDELVDILGLTSLDILDAFEDVLLEKIDLFPEQHDVEE